MNAPRFDPFNYDDKQVIERIRSLDGKSCGDKVLDRLYTLFSEEAERLDSLNDRAKDLWVYVGFLRQIERLERKTATRQRYIECQTELLADVGIDVGDE